MRLFPVLLASVGVLGVAATCSPARADWDDDGWRHHEWHEHQERRWREHEWRERQRQSYHAAPPVIYSVPPAYSYTPQGYYVAPPPAYYAPPPPPPIYQNPGVSVGFGFGFR